MSILLLIGIQWNSSRMAADISVQLGHSVYVAELGDVQNQPGGRVQHGLKPVEEIASDRNETRTNRCSDRPDPT